VTKNRLLLLASLPLTIVLAIGVLGMLPPRPGVTRANFDRIEMGMTEAEVEEIFGGKGKQEQCGCVWNAYDGSWSTMTFDHDCVDTKRWTDSDNTFLHRIRRWLHLQ
jgi:hypothetical protein